MSLIYKKALTRVEDRCILFYTTYDPISKRLIHELGRIPKLAEQIEAVCVHQPNGMMNRILPRQVKELLAEDPLRVPMVVAAGINEIIYGREALEWLNNGILRDNGGVITMDLTEMGTTGVKLDRGGGLSRARDELFEDSEYHLTGKGHSRQINTGDRMTTIEKMGTMMDLIADTTDKHTAGRDAMRRLKELEHARSREDWEAGHGGRAARMDPRGHPMDPRGHPMDTRSQAHPRADVRGMPMVPAMPQAPAMPHAPAMPQVPMMGGRGMAMGGGRGMAMPAVPQIPMGGRGRMMPRGHYYQ